jgi:hypothetical protein
MPPKRTAADVFREAGDPVTSFVVRGNDGHKYQVTLDGDYDEWTVDVIGPWVAAAPEAKCKITRMANPKKKVRSAARPVSRKWFLTNVGELRPIDQVFRGAIY